LAHSLILTLPGTPVQRNGDEIGMGENLDLEERDAIRSPMQRANAKNGGFSPADRVVLPVGIVY
jgi:maltose alpha-D-glucosyltransferase / alpha-amylase